MAINDGDDARDFRVQPEVLRAYAATIRAQSGSLRDAGDALAAATVDHDWFGKLPQSRNLADGYAAHHHIDLAVIADLVSVLLDTATALATTADRYSTVDGAAEGAFRAVRNPRTGSPGMRVPLATAIR